MKLRWSLTRNAQDEVTLRAPEEDPSSYDSNTIRN